jgi:lipopolysaccharide transport system permease protein
LDWRKVARTIVVLIRISLHRQFRQWRWWWLLVVAGQILFAGIVFFAFSSLFPRIGGRAGATVTYGFLVYSGILVWSLVQDSALQAGTLFREHRAYIMRFRLPLWCYAVGGMGGRTLVLLTGLVVLAAARIAVYGGLSWRLWLLLLYVPGILVTALGMSWLVALATSLEQRLNHVLPHLLLMWFFATPVVYPRSALPAGLQQISMLNPMAHVVECFQWIWLPIETTSWVSWAVALLLMVTAFGGGLLATRTLTARVVDSL